MKAAVDGREFFLALSKVCKAIKRSKIPELEGTLIQFEDGVCTLTATNLSVWLRTQIPARGENFSFVLERTKELTKACKHFNSELTLDLTETEKRGQLAMTCGDRTGVFWTAPAQAFPIIPQVERTPSFTANAAALLERIKRVRYATQRAQSKHRPDITCVQFRENTVFAIDGRRMACETDDTLHIPTPFMASPEALEHLQLFGGADVKFCFQRTRCHVSDGVTSLIFELTLHEVYDPNQAIPGRFCGQILVKPKEVLRELAYLKEFAPQSKPYVRFSNGLLTMDGVNGSYSARVSIEGSCEISFGFDLRFMEDAMRQFAEEKQVRLKIGGVLVPFVIESETRGAYALLCPVRLREEKAA